MARVPGQTMPQQAVGGIGVSGAKNNPEMAKRTSQLLLSETKATIPNVQNHIAARAKQSAEKERKMTSEMNNLYGKKSHE